LKEKLLSYLVCPSCQRSLELSVADARDGEIIEGELRCTSCSSSFPITSGIPRFANLDEVDSDKRATAAGFGWQWQHFTQEDERYAEQFLGWIAPVTPEFFRNKIVLEGGCGKGRHTQLAARWGAREVIGIDLSAAVETAFAATRSLPNAHIIQAAPRTMSGSRVGSIRCAKRSRLVSTSGRCCNCRRFPLRGFTSPQSWYMDY
jgi:uncharacterized protein YbaR (Trm112 family)